MGINSGKYRGQEKFLLGLLYSVLWHRFIFWTRLGIQHSYFGGQVYCLRYCLIFKGIIVSYLVSDTYYGFVSDKIVRSSTRMCWNGLGTSWMTPSIQSTHVQCSYSNVQLPGATLALAEVWKVKWKSGIGSGTYPW